MVSGVLSAPVDHTFVMGVARSVSAMLTPSNAGAPRAGVGPAGKGESVGVHQQAHLRLARPAEQDGEQVE